MVKAARRSDDLRAGDTYVHLKFRAIDKATFRVSEGKLLYSAYRYMCDPRRTPGLHQHSQSSASEAPFWRRVAPGLLLMCAGEELSMPRHFSVLPRFQRTGTDWKKK